jgi:hypothetical protein
MPSTTGQESFTPHILKTKSQSLNPSNNPLSDTYYMAKPTPYSG